VKKREKRREGKGREGKRRKMNNKSKSECRE
jgi:hypothetical protein